ncbi:MAG: zf-HC2 domain-containing protein [Bryobacterales bacterium]|nr:zf-HC2 domain-containing protein [Bryobacterales bacterium]
MAKHFDAPVLLRRLDGELSPTEAAEVDQHLACCWRCRAESEQIRRQISEVAGIFTQCEFSNAHLQRGLLRLERSLPPPVHSGHCRYRIGIALLAAGFLAASAHWIREAPLPTPAVTAQSRKPTVPKPVLPAPARVARVQIPPAVTPVVEPITVTDVLPTASDRLPLLHVEVLYALHRANADLGEPITISRTDHGVVVEGVVDSDHRLSQLAAALQEIDAGPLLTIRLESAEDSVPMPPSLPTLTLAVSAATPAIQPLLDAQDMRFPAALARSAVALSSGALDHAWAIRRLEAALSPEDRHHLPAAGRWLLDQIRADHEAAIESSRQSLRTLLVPMLALSTEPQTPPAGSAFDRAVLIRDLVHSLFAGRQTPADYPTPETMLGALHALLR